MYRLFSIYTFYLGYGNHPHHERGDPTKVAQIIIGQAINNEKIPDRL